MSTTIPPLSPESESEAHRAYQKFLDEFREYYQHYQAVAEFERKRPLLERAAQPVASTLSLWLPGVITSILQGFTVVGLLGFVFWFGGVSTTVADTAARVKALEDAVSGDRRESLSNRLSVVETKMSVVETKLDNIDKKLDQLAASPRNR
jgi:hypothetical protein